MSKLGLRERLFLSNLIVMMVGLSTLLAVGKFYSPQFFILQLQQLEGTNLTLYSFRRRLVDGFESAWSRGALWSVVVGASAAGGISYVLSKRIMRPLIQIEEVTRKLAEGASGGADSPQRDSRTESPST